jgi:hypothetical protein
MRLRSASPIADQHAISSSVRKQPLQRPLAGSIAQTPIQGDTTGEEFVTAADLRLNRRLTWGF